MDKKALKKEVEQLLEEKETIQEQLRKIARSIDPTESWRFVLRTKLDIPDEVIN